MKLGLLFLLFMQATDGTVSKDIVKDDVVVIIAKSSGCIASDMIRQRFNNTEVKLQVQKNSQVVYVVHGDKHPKYLKAHKVKWYPNTIRIKRGQDGYLRESNRFIGIGTITNIPEFLSIRKRITPRQVMPQPGGS